MKLWRSIAMTHMHVIRKMTEKIQRIKECEQFRRKEDEWMDKDQ